MMYCTLSRVLNEPNSSLPHDFSALTLETHSTHNKQTAHPQMNKLEQQPKAKRAALFTQHKVFELRGMKPPQKPTS